MATKNLKNNGNKNYIWEGTFLLTLIVSFPEFLVLFIIPKGIADFLI